MATSSAGTKASAWKTGKAMRLSQLELNSNQNKSINIPEFKPEWEEEYAGNSFETLEIKLISLVFIVYFICHFFSILYGSDDDGAGYPDRIWVLYTWLPELISGVQSIILVIVLSSASKPWCMRHYNSLCAFTIIVWYLAMIVPLTLLELRRAWFQTESQSNIVWGIDFSVFPPLRTCNDTDTDISFQHAAVDGNAVGCNNLILSGDAFTLFVLCNVLPRICRLRAAWAVIISFTNALVMAAALIAVGSMRSEWVMIFPVIFQLSAGLGGAYFCHIRYAFSREQFAVAKGMKFATEQNRNLLFTLIPPNVYHKLATHKGPGMLGNEIRDCTIMFCSLEPQDELQSSFTGKAFSILNEVFSDFDSAVQRFGMFKYQHVSDWYIVACPRAACPFDADEQSTAYPPQYARSMILLAQELQGIAQGYRSSARDTPLWLKVGINCGPVAGAVIGTLRAFYCLYGDTINTSARMCKYATDRIHCTPAFAERASACCNVPRPATGAGGGDVDDEEEVQG